MKNEERARVSNVISIKNGRVLLVKKPCFWIFPGGKMKEREKFRACIIRELSE